MNRLIDNKTSQPTAKTVRWVKFFTHLLCLSLIFILPEALMSRSMPDGIHWHMYLKSLIYVAVFYLNYYIIIDRCLDHRYWILKLICANLVLVGLLLLFEYLYWPPFEGRPGESIKADTLRRMSMGLRDAMMVFLTASLSLAMKLSDRSNRLRELEASAREEELKHLKNQLNPHFLFNSLNTIYALVSIDPDKAAEAIHELSRLLRYALYETSPEVTLNAEMQFIDTYIKLMKLRLPADFHLSVNLPADVPDSVKVPPLLFISPVENAFKYGVNGSADAAISINIGYSEGTIDCLIINSVSADLPHRHDSGIGDNNLRRRLALIYGNRASLSTSLTDNTYRFSLTINTIT